MSERLRILEMVKDGKISPEDGVRLLDELEGAPGGDVSRTVKVHVWSPGGRRIQVALPARLATSIAAMIPEKTRARLIDRGIDIDALLKAVQQGTSRGRIVDVREPGGTVVEVIVE